MSLHATKSVYTHISTGFTLKSDFQNTDFTENQKLERISLTFNLLAFTVYLLIALAVADLHMCLPGVHVVNPTSATCGACPTVQH